jgi:8-oxo-dGTP diphosphatase
VKIEIDEMRLILDPPMIECIHCGNDGFYVRGRASGFLRDSRSMKDGRVANNQHMWDDVKVVHDDQAYCDACNEKVGKVIGCAPDNAPEYFGNGLAENRTVEISCLADVREGRILLVRKKGQDFLILPGGKPEPFETEEAALKRELDEELKARTKAKPKLVGIFRDRAGGVKDVDVIVTLFSGTLKDEPIASAEIESIHWTDVSTGLQDDGTAIPLAPSIRNLILPYLSAKAARKAK